MEINWTRIWLALIALLAITVVSCETRGAYQDRLAAEAIEAGADPMQVVCALKPHMATETYCTVVAVSERR